MAFLTVGALAIALLVAAPIAAHLLRRGQRTVVDFPLVRLVRPMPKLASRSGRFQDKALFSVRAALVLTLALLGAVPLVECDHPVLTRQQGASVALALVLDDSGSMRATLPDGAERFEKAKQRVLQLIGQLHEGDLVSLVLAGKPARLLANATPQRQMVRELCQKASSSDRNTDLSTAIQLAEGSLRNLPHNDRRIVVFSDLGQPLPKVSVPLWFPMPELATQVHDCGITLAIRRETQVTVEVACTDDSAARARHVNLVKRGIDGRTASRASNLAMPLALGVSVQKVAFDAVGSDAELDARLDGQDANTHNDAAPVFAGASGTVVATLTDYTTARAATGGPPLVEQALAAFGGDIVLRPWTTLPEDDRLYNDVSLLVLDDPSPLGPEARVVLEKWLGRGGTAIAWLGPRAMGDALGTSLSPFLDGKPGWESTDVEGFDVKSLQWLGVAGSSLSDLHPKGRLSIDNALPPTSTVRARWADFRAAAVERNLGKGDLWTLGIPISPDQSDMALRPGFIAILEHILEQTRLRGISPVTVVGRAWKFDKEESIQIRDPQGISAVASSFVGRDFTEKTYTPAVAGLYAIARDGHTEYRLAHGDAEEITESPHPSDTASTHPLVPKRSRFDISPQLTWVLAILMVLELVLSTSRKRGAREDAGRGLEAH